MNTDLKEFIATAVEYQLIKGGKDVAMGCASLVELMDCIPLKYGQIPPGDLMKNQNTMQAVYHIEYPIETNLIRSIRSNTLQSQGIVHSLVACWKTWASPIY